MQRSALGLSAATTGWSWRWSLFVLACVVIAGQAEVSVGHGFLLWLLTGLSLALLQFMRFGPVSWFYAYMSVFFVLGCWFKVMVHHIWDYPYVEPVGGFGGSPADWQEYYWFACLMASALLVARGVELLLRRKRNESQPGQVPVVPAALWVGLFLLACGFYAVNNAAAFFVTGVDARLRLPFGLNAPLAFMALIGFALVLASLVERDLRARGRLSMGAATAVLLVAMIASISMASRAAVVMQAVPILIAAYWLQSRWGRHPISLKPLLLLVLVVSTVLVVVSLYRVRVFAGFSGGDSEMAAFFLLESASLVVDRWVGAEALMVAVGEVSRSPELFGRLMVEDPAIGADSIYQTLSGGKYELLQGLTFLTLPGYFAVIGLAGEAWMIFGLTLLMMLLGLAFERLAHGLLRGQTVPLALACAAVANALTQLSFPQLMLPFLFQMLAICALLGLLQRPSDRSARR